MNSVANHKLCRTNTQGTGIACGIFLAALQAANLATLTSTPMGAESKIRGLLGRQVIGLFCRQAIFVTGSLIPREILL
jgi:hypothetical protein